MIWSLWAIGRPTLSHFGWTGAERILSATAASVLQMFCVQLWHICHILCLPGWQDGSQGGSPEFYWMELQFLLSSPTSFLYMLETIFRTKKWAGHGKRGHPEVFRLAGIFCSCSIYSWLRNGNRHGTKGDLCVPCSPLFLSFVPASKGMLLWKCLCFWIWSEGCLKSLVCPQKYTWKTKTNPSKPNQNEKNPMQ